MTSSHYEFFSKLLLIWFHVLNQWWFCYSESIEIRDKVTDCWEKLTNLYRQNTKAINLYDHLDQNIRFCDHKTCHLLLFTLPCFHVSPPDLPRLLGDFEDKRAQAVCTLAYCGGRGKPVHLFRGSVDGTIVSPRGPRNFGWDPIFQPDGFDLTYAELDKAIKNTISHRYKAVLKLKEFISEENSLWLSNSLIAGYPLCLNMSFWCIYCGFFYHVIVCFPLATFVYVIRMVPM